MGSVYSLIRINHMVLVKTSNNHLNKMHEQQYLKVGQIDIKTLKEHGNWTFRCVNNGVVTQWKQN